MHIINVFNDLINSQNHEPIHAMLAGQHQKTKKLEYTLDAKWVDSLLAFFIQFKS